MRSPFTDQEWFALWDALDAPNELEITDIAEHNPELASALRVLREFAP